METVIANFWQAINDNISYIVVLLVVTSGYIVRWLKVFPQFSTTLKIALLGCIVSIVYTLLSDVTISQWLVSYFVAFGFHTVIIKKLIDEPLNIN